MIWLVSFFVGLGRVTPVVSQELMPLEYLFRCSGSSLTEISDSTFPHLQASLVRFRCSDDVLMRKGIWPFELVHRTATSYQRHSNYPYGYREELCTKKPSSAKPYCTYSVAKFFVSTLRVNGSLAPVRPDTEGVRDIRVGDALVFGQRRVRVTELWVNSSREVVARLASCGDAHNHLVQIHPTSELEFFDPAHCQ